MDGILVVGIALLIGVPLVATAAVRVAASIPACEPDGRSESVDPVPRFPGWITRTWLLAALTVPILLLDYSSSPTAWIFWWSLAGPFTLEHFGSSSISEAIVMASVLFAMVTAHPVWPNRATAVLSLIGVGSWFMLGFGYLRMAV